MNFNDSFQQQTVRKKSKQNLFSLKTDIWNEALFETSCFGWHADKKKSVSSRTKRTLDNKKVKAEKKTKQGQHPFCWPSVAAAAHTAAATARCAQHAHTRSAYMHAFHWSMCLFLRSFFLSSSGRRLKKSQWCLHTHRNNNENNKNSKFVGDSINLMQDRAQKNVFRGQPKRTKCAYYAQKQSRV